MAEVGVTKQVLAYSIKDLMTRQPLAKITVGDVCTSCGMNRKSFYYHFQDKYDLVTWIFRGELAQEAEGASELKELLPSLCRTMERNVPFYRSALKEGGQNSLQECVAEELRPAVAAALQSAGYAQPQLADLFVAIICFMMVRWVQAGCDLSTEEFLASLRETAEAAGAVAGGR